eukprot:10579096-Alexandrium_andersonii.AAC.1
MVLNAFTIRPPTPPPTRGRALGSALALADLAFYWPVPGLQCQAVLRCPLPAPHVQRTTCLITRRAQEATLDSPAHRGGFKQLVGPRPLVDSHFSFLASRGRWPWNSRASA